MTGIFEMVHDEIDFQMRLRRLIAKHRGMSRGYKTKMRKDGLIVVKPHRSKSPISMKSFLLFIAAFMLFKGFLIANVGPDAYGERVARLQDGTIVEQAGGYVMQIDPVSELVAMKMGPVLR